VLADEKRLRQVLLNLLGNAVKFTDRGRVRFGVQALSQDETGARLRFEVEDSGVGMTPEQLAKLFLPFGRVGDVRRRAGSGLGLMISRQLVQLMGSEIQVESRPDEGSRFWFEVTLPVAELAAPLRPSARTPIGYEGPRRKVLVADDVVSNRAVLLDLLSGLGFEVCEAANGQEAVEQELAASPDLAVMDLVMPGMGGLEAMQCIRRNRQARGLLRLPFIVISASANEEDQAPMRKTRLRALQPVPTPSSPSRSTRRACCGSSARSWGSPGSMADRPRSEPGTGRPRSSWCRPERRWPSCIPWPWWATCATSASGQPI
jgi:CheY-like chemotaxis protein